MHCFGSTILFPLGSWIERKSKRDADYFTNTILFVSPIPLSWR
jgi:hypothetical protein